MGIQGGASPPYVIRITGNLFWLFFVQDMGFRWYPCIFCSAIVVADIGTDMMQRLCAVLGAVEPEPGMCMKMAQSHGADASVVSADEAGIVRTALEWAGAGNSGRKYAPGGSGAQCLHGSCMKMRRTASRYGGDERQMCDEWLTRILLNSEDRYGYSIWNTRS